MSIETMKMALEALESCTPEDTSTGHVVWPSYDEQAVDQAITALRTAIEQAEKQEPVAWNNAAIRLGEELSSIGPDGYYNMTAEQWLDWAMDQKPRGKNSLPAAQRQWVGLTDEEMHECWGDPLTPLGMKHARMIEAKLREKNT